MQIRHAVPEDARAVAEIHVDAWRAAYADIMPEAFLASLTVSSRQAFWDRFLAEKQGDLKVAMEGGRLLGWINTGPCRDVGATRDEAEIWAFYVSPVAWSTGVGRQLWVSARNGLIEQGHRQCHLWFWRKTRERFVFIKQPGLTETNSLQKPLSWVD